MNRLLLTAGLIAGLTALASFGCNAKPPATYDDNTIKAAEQFRKIGIAYNKASQGRRKSLTAEDLKEFLKKDGESETLLISPRDGKPIVIVPGFSPNIEAKDDELSIVAYEQTGADGKRMTVDIRGTVVLVSDAEFAEIKFVGGHQPAR